MLMIKQKDGQQLLTLTTNQAHIQQKLFIDLHSQWLKAEGVKEQISQP